MRIYLDTNVFISAVEARDNDESRAAIWRLLSLSEQHGSLLTTSVLSLAELLVRPLELNQDALVSTYIDLLEPGDRRGLSVVPIGKEVLILAAHIRKDDKSIKLPDAIHRATAELESCSAFLTSDRQLIGKRSKLCKPVIADVIDGLIEGLG